MNRWNRHFNQYPTTNWFMLWLLIFCGSILLFPANKLPEQIEQWLQQYHFAFGLGILIACSYFMSQLLLSGWEQLDAYLRRFQRQQSIEKMIQHLDFSEKAVLREFVLQRKSVLNLPVNEPAVRNLLDSRVLDFAYGQPLNEEFTNVRSLMIALEARPLITYKLLGLSSSKLTEEQMEYLMNSRPKFVNKHYLR